MSLLRRQTSLSDIIHEDDEEEPQSADYASVFDDHDDQDDIFADDVDDDDLSFDGIYDDEDPPLYREPSPPVDLPELPRLLDALSIVGKRPSTSNHSPRPQAYYPGIDVCIVRTWLYVHSPNVLSLENRSVNRGLPTRRTAKVFQHAG